VLLAAEKLEEGTSDLGGSHFEDKAVAVETIRLLGKTE
jgi:hypothetical protein